MRSDWLKKVEFGSGMQIFCEEGNMANLSPANQLYTAKIEDTAGRERSLEFWIGDIATTSGSLPVDLLVFSAFPNDYLPIPGTVIHRLGEQGIDVARVAETKLFDFRESWQTWVSVRLEEQAAIKQLICFEPEVDTRAENLVGNVFRAVRENLLSLGYSGERPIECLRLPLLATGQRRAAKREMLAAMLSQSYIHLGAGLPVRRLQIFLGLKDDGLDSLLFEAGIQLEQARQRWLLDFATLPTPERDLFVSYRHHDLQILKPLLVELKRLRPELTLFMDREELEPGAYWKQDLIRGLSSCRRALCFVTEGYPRSVECMDEFHAGVLWGHRRPGFLVPVLNLDEKKIGELPETIRRVHCIMAGLPKQAVAEVAEEVIEKLEADLAS
ncbi:MAG: TIR domain-containing protein [Planctomycetota bacterium]|jgi:hypothetical protein